MSFLQYPVGPRPPFTKPLTPAERARCITQLAQAPVALRAGVDSLSNERLDTSYRPGGWTVRQVTHHLADTHLHYYARVRLALTESEPSVTAFDENAWAELHDARSGQIEPSLALFDAMHRRLDLLLSALPAPMFERTILHPSLGQLTLDALLIIFSWHARHHIAQITSLREREGW